MSKFHYEKFTMRFSFFLAFIAFIGVFVYAYMTEMAVELPKDNQAPFTEETLVENEDQILPLTDRYLSLEKPHRTNKELQSWISMAVSESLSFDSQDFKEVQSAIRPYFTSYGYRQYQEYLTKSQILESLKANDYRISVFAEDNPLLLNGSAMENIYRWLYEVPVTVSFVPRNATSLVGRESMVNSKIKVRLQIRRIKLDKDPNAIQIESWAVEGRR